MEKDTKKTHDLKETKGETKQSRGSRGSRGGGDRGYSESVSEINIDLKGTIQSNIHRENSEIKNNRW